MRFHYLLGAFLSLGVSFQAIAAEKAFQIADIKIVTANVDRYNYSTGNTFATVFCNSENPEAMIVDSQLPTLDGKIFRFSSLTECNEARRLARSLYKKCRVFLVIDQNSETARVDTSHCN